ARRATRLTPDSTGSSSPRSRRWEIADHNHQTTRRHRVNASGRDGTLDWSEASVLVTGGTGSFGNKFVEIMLSRYRPRRLVVFSRDELKQSEMMARFQHRIDHPSLRFFVGDVRDQARLQRAMHGVDGVFHAAALKQIPSCEYNPFEAIQTNVIGVENVINAAIDAGVTCVVMIR